MDALNAFSFNLLVVGNEVDDGRACSGEGGISTETCRNRRKVGLYVEVMTMMKI